MAATCATIMGPADVNTSTTTPRKEPAVSAHGQVIDDQIAAVEEALRARRDQKIDDQIAEVQAALLYRRLCACP